MATAALGRRKGDKWNAGQRLNYFLFKHLAYVVWDRLLQVARTYTVVGWVLAISATYDLWENVISTQHVGEWAGV